MAVRERRCARCAGQFSYEVGRGRDRIHCSEECRTAHGRARALASKPTHLCSAPGCEHTVRSRGATLCEMHYGRMRRTGTLNRAQPAERIEHTHGYQLVVAPDHPLCAEGRIRVYEHRKVFYDGHGDGPFNCHVCGTEVSWQGMHVDHLDDDPSNNALNNLAPACPTCNQWRGKEKMVRRQPSQGTRIEAFGKTMCLSEWASQSGLPRTTLARRLRDGWAAERALLAPSGPTGAKHHSAKTARAEGIRP